MNKELFMHIITLLFLSCFVFVKRNIFSMGYLYSLQGHCLSRCSIAVKGHHDQGNSYK